jgi:SAM-dependent methyltransferase
MSVDQKPRTSELNGRLWGQSAEDWANIQEATCKPVYEAVLNQVGIDSGSQYLDVGCGSGMAAQLAKERGVEVHGVDAAAALVDIARRRTPDGDFRIGDIEELPFEDDKFDLVTGFNSFQYAGNPLNALTEARRVAKNGSLVVVMTWGQPDGMEAASLVTALGPLLPPPPPGASGPFALSDETALRAFAEKSGLRAVEVIDVESPWQYANHETALAGLRSSGVAFRAIENTNVEAVDSANSKALEPFRQEDGSYRIGATFRCLYAKA